MIYRKARMVHFPSHFHVKWDNNCNEWQHSGIYTSNSRNLFYASVLFCCSNIIYTTKLYFLGKIGFGSG